MGLEKEDIMALISILQKGLVDEDEPQVTVTPTHQPKKVAKKPKRVAKNTKPKRPNKFETMSERNMHQGDIEIDKKLNKYPPTERTRQFKYMNVVCRVCGKKEQVNPVLVDSPDRYKCNKCCGSGG